MMQKTHARLESRVDIVIHEICGVVFHRPMKARENVVRGIRIALHDATGVVLQTNEAVLWGWNLIRQDLQILFLAEDP
jgi:hypothetical protein